MAQKLVEQSPIAFFCYIAQLEPDILLAFLLLQMHTCYMCRHVCIVALKHGDSLPSLPLILNPSPLFLVCEMNAYTPDVHFPRHASVNLVSCLLSPH